MQIPFTLQLIRELFPTITRRKFSDFFSNLILCANAAALTHADGEARLALMQQFLGSPVTGVTAWRRADIGDEWLYTFTDADIAELEQAARHAQRSGNGHLGFTRGDFPLDALGDRIAGLLADVESGRGFFVLRGLPLHRYDRETAETVYWGLGRHFGTAISQNAKGQRLVEVCDRGHDYTEINSRGYTTRARLLPHVDTSDMTALLCLHPAKEGGLSTLASSMTIYNEVLARHPEHLELLFRGFHHDLRGEGVTGRLDEVTNNRIPVFSFCEGQLSCCFNYKAMETAADKIGQPLTALEREALDFIVETADRSDIRFDMALERGDIQLINNYAVLHSRSDFVDYPEPERKRNMLRLWVNFHNGRPLAPAFADRFNTGARGGVAVGPGGGYAI